MHPHEPDALCEMQELAALSALGGLEPEEAHRLEEHLAAGCEECRAEVEAVAALAARLAEDGASGVRPPADLKTRVLERVGGADLLAGGAVIEQAGFRFVRSASLDWRTRGNIAVKRLSVDHTRGNLTQLVQMPPRSRIPRHRHAGAEELYVLSGELIVDGVRMNAGDYCLARPDTVHDDVRSEVGCTFLSVSSLEDKFVGDNPSTE